MNNKGFISISVVYSFFIVFLMLLLFIVDGYVNNRTVIKKISERITKDVIATKFCEAHYREKVCDLYPDYDPDNNNHGLIYHNFSITNGANDNSYRFSGSNPNNYVCFETNDDDCKKNLFRIIGLIPVEVVTENTSTSIKTEEKVLYKLIKNDALGSSGYDSSKIYIETNGIISDTTFECNTWSTSALNINNLNESYLNSLDNNSGILSNKIANVIWKVGGNTNLTSEELTISGVYTNEIINSSFENTIDGSNEIANKVGLLYLSDYGFASLPVSWDSSLSNQIISENNWLFKNVQEWTITRDSSNRINAYIIKSNGIIENSLINGTTAYYRPVFYLKDDIFIITDNHDGSINNPYRLSGGV